MQKVIKLSTEHTECGVLRIKGGAQSIIYILSHNLQRTCFYCQKKHIYINTFISLLAGDKSQKKDRENEIERVKLPCSGDKTNCSDLI